MLNKDDKIVITGAAGLVGQNLILLLRERGYKNITAIDMQPFNLQILSKLNPTVNVVLADLAESGDWQNQFNLAKVVIILHAQITGLDSNEFKRNNLNATENVLKAIKQFQVPYIVHVSSSVVNSVANDAYTQTKTEQENLVINSGINYCVLRPTLMFGWFDRKHFGWLSRFMEKWPVFPIPGNGCYVRQPLYSRDFCRIIIAAMEQQPRNQTYDIVGQQDVNYIDIIRTIKKIKKLRTYIVKIPYHLFYFLLKCAAFVTSKPPFTADQLTALTAGDYFKGIDPEIVFGVKMTEFERAVDETFNNPEYSEIVLNR